MRLWEDHGNRELGNASCHTYEPDSSNSEDDYGNHGIFCKSIRAEVETKATDFCGRLRSYQLCGIYDQELKHDGPRLLEFASALFLACA